MSLSACYILAFPPDGEVRIHVLFPPLRPHPVRCGVAGVNRCGVGLQEREYGAQHGNLHICFRRVLRART
eukprot:364368-Chlamydomonas_euryale.AAC.4